MRYFVEIDKSGNDYTGSIHQGDQDKARSLGELQLGPDAVITIKGQSYALGDLIETLLKYDSEELKNVFDERGQLEIGQHLYTQLFGNLRHYEHHTDETVVRGMRADF